MRFAFWCITSSFFIRFLRYAHQIKRLVLTILTSIITFFQCKYFKRYHRRKNTCCSFLSTPNHWKYLNKLLQASFCAVISSKVLALVKRNYSRQNCNNHTFILICMSFRSNIKKQELDIERKVHKKESITTDLLFVSTTISLKVCTYLIEVHNFMIRVNNEEV